MTKSARAIVERLEDPDFFSRTGTRGEVLEAAMLIRELVGADRVHLSAKQGMEKRLTARITELEAERDVFRSALKGLSDMYASTWDRVDGALVMMSAGVKRFEKAHEVAHKLLNKKPPRTLPLQDSDGKEKPAESEHSPSTVNRNQVSHGEKT